MANPTSNKAKSPTGATKPDERSQLRKIVGGLAILVVVVGVFFYFELRNVKAVANQAFLQLVNPTLSEGHPPFGAKIKLKIKNAGFGNVKILSALSKHVIAKEAPQFERMLEDASQPNENVVNHYLGEDDEVEFEVDIPDLKPPGEVLRKLHKTVYFAGRIRYHNETLDKDRIYNFMFRLDLNSEHLILLPIRSDNLNIDEQVAPN